MTTNEIIGLIVFILVVTAIYLIEAVILLRLIIRRARHRQINKFLWSKSAIAIHIIATIAVVCLVYGWLIEPYRIEVKTIPIHTDKLKNSSFRIVQISDLHCNRKPLNEKKMVTLVNNLKPDVVVFTGDALNTAEALPLFKETLSALNAGLGKFAVRGNFETDRRKNLNLYDSTGFQLLEQDTVTLERNGEQIHMSGLRCDAPAACRPLLEKIPRRSYSIFLYHWSDLIEQIDDLNVDLYLCGHTHGGQVALPFYGAVTTLSKLGKKYEAGMYTAGRTILYVNRGIGLERFPAPKVRFLARPEITVFDVQPVVR